MLETQLDPDVCSRTPTCEGATAAGFVYDGMGVDAVHNGRRSGNGPLCVATAAVAVDYGTIDRVIPAMGAH